MKKIFFLFLFSAISMPYSGMYFEDGLTIFDYYSSDKEDGDKVTDIEIGIAYLEKQGQSNNKDKPTLIQSGSLEAMLAYKRSALKQLNDDELSYNLDVIKFGFAYYNNNRKFAYNYQNAFKQTGNLVDYFNDLGGTIKTDMQIQELSFGWFEKIANQPHTLFLNFVHRVGKMEMLITHPAAGTINISESGDVNYIELGIGFEVYEKFIIQPILTITEDSENNFAISSIFNL